MTETQKSLSCPQCGSQKLYKDGIRYTFNGQIQRWLCRNCGYRFTEKNRNSSEAFQPLSRIHTKSLKSNFAILSKRQVCDCLTEASKNLTEVARQKTAQREGTPPQQSALILEYAWQAKKHGLAELTIKQRVYKLKLLIKKGANLSDPDTVLTVLATNNWTQANKRAFVIAYQSFAKTFNIIWQPPKTRVERKLPYIPIEEENSQLIAGCGKKTATFLQVLKDTGARTVEATKIR